MASTRLFAWTTKGKGAGILAHVIMERRKKTVACRNRAPAIRYRRCAGTLKKADMVKESLTRMNIDRFGGDRTWI